MTTFLILAATTISTLYQNDFSTRTSAEPLGSAWTTYRYAPRVPIAYNFENNGISSTGRLTTPYDFWTMSAPGKGNQDGWTKCFSDGRYNNNCFVTVSDETNPALVFTDKDVMIGGSNTLAVLHSVTLMHPLRNVFTNGVLKAQFDIRQPKYDDSSIFSWFRLMEEYDMDLTKGSNGNFPIELGLSAGSLSGGWREAGMADGERVFKSSSGEGCGGATTGHWYRYYITYRLAPGDAARADFEAYDMGMDRLPMDTRPSGSPKWQHENLLFRRNLSATMGGISGIMIRFYHVDTKGYYGETGYDDDRAYKYDNIKVAWQAPGTTAFVECYRNDFTTSKRRTVDGSASVTYAYAQETLEQTTTFDYEYATVTKSLLDGITTDQNEKKPNSNDYYAFIRDASDHTGGSTPYLGSAYLGTRANQPHPVGVDGWRIAGHASYQAQPVVTRVNGNLALYCAGFGMARQLMCEEITSGKVKFEFDQRMPAGWTGTPRCDIDLISRKGYDEGYNNTDNSSIRAGLSSTGTSGAKTKIEKSYSFYAWGKCQNDTQATNYKPLTWYRIQEFVDLDNKKADIYVYEIGADAPATPEAFDSSDTSTAIAKYIGVTFDNWAAAKSYQTGIAAWGFTNFLESQDDVKDADGTTIPADDVRALIDNVRFWKQDGESWKLLFQNDFKKCTRVFTGKKGKISLGSFVDRPEYGTDGWAACPAYAADAQIMGNDAVIQLGDDYNSIVHPLGRNIRSGRMTAQYDVRLPAYWIYDKLQVEFGGGTMASASTGNEPCRFNGHSAIRTGFNRGYLSSSGGIYCKASYRHDQKGKTDVFSTQMPYSWGEESVTNTCWYRVRIDADVSAHKYTISYYKMGTVHPTVDTPDGDLIYTYADAPFRYSDEPISHIWIFGGKTWSYAPWQDDAPGALLVDNIKVCHDKQGVLLMLR